MSNASLKEQLQAVASQISDVANTKKHTAPKKAHQPNKSAHQHEKSERRKPKWLEYVQYGVELLKAYFPACFKSGNEIKPLKKGIKQDLLKRLSTMAEIVTEDKACMVKSLAYYVNTMAYHKSVIDGAPRIDLDGNFSGIVSAEEAKYSIERHQAKLHTKQQSVVNKKAESRDELEVI
ncbi:MAG: hypothetical protein ACD_46C00014G0004 [uncultured bacterium]|nr:MAG: hypothetical protein ACD_46C00014G0004 [uncultured bacterium]